METKFVAMATKKGSFVDQFGTYDLGILNERSNVLAGKGLLGTCYYANRFVAMVTKKGSFVDQFGILKLKLLALGYSVGLDRDDEKPITVKTNVTITK